MSAHYEIRLTDDIGYHVGALDRFEKFGYVKSLGLPGTFILAVPDIYPDRYWAPDRLIQFWRRGPGQRKVKLDFLGLLRYWRYQVDAAGRSHTVLMGYDQNSLLDRRIVAYASGTDEAMIDALEADDALKKLVRENLGSLATVSDRDLTAAGLDVQVDLSLGATITKEHAWRNVGQVMRDIAAMTREKTPEILYWVRVTDVRPGQIALRFETATSYLGRDHTADSRQPLYFGRQFGNVGQVALEYDYTATANHIYAGGQGEGTERKIVEASDALAEGASTFGRIERFADVRNTGDANVSDEADQALAEGRPVVRFDAELLDTPQAYYGDWDLGDLVPILHRGISVDALVRSVKVDVGPGGQTVSARISEIIT